MTLKAYKKFKTGILNGYKQSYSIQGSAQNFQKSEKGDKIVTIQARVIKPCSKKQTYDL